MKYNVLITDPLSEVGLQPLQDATHLNVTVATDLTEEQLLENITTAHALLVRSQTQVTREVIEQGKQLKVIGRAGVGVDNIDLEAATEQGIVVVNAPNGNINSAAEHTIAMLMSLARKIPQAHKSLLKGSWDRSSYIGVEVKGKTLGVIGLGRIGTEVAYRAKGQRMNVIGYDPFFTAEKAESMGIVFGSIEEILKEADFITVHTPLMEETHHLIDEKALKMMKETAYLINCARGGIIDEDALYEAIKNKEIAGAALDVFEEEPAINHPLFELNEVVATPHLGGSTIEAQESVAIDVSRDVVGILSGELAKHPVNIPSFPPDVLSKIEPYFSLAEQLGSFLGKLTGKVIQELHISYAGVLNEIETAPITRSVIKGLLRKHLGDRINNINATYIASKRDINIHEHKTTQTDGFTNLLTVKTVVDGKTYRVSGTLSKGLGPRIVQIDEYATDVVPESHMLFIEHKDQPGAIGQVGMVLAKEAINIASMQVARKEAGGEAMMILTVDKPLPESTEAKVQSIQDIYSLISIDL